MKKYSNVHQLGFIVKDMEKAMDYYGKIYHIKKWYGVVNEPQGKLYYKGKEFSDDGYDMRLGYCGKTEIELITTNAEENIYTEFLKKCGEGLHHISFFVKDVKKSIAEYEQLGFEVVQNGTINGKSMISEFAYMRQKGDEGFENIVEVCSVKTKGGLSMTRKSWNIGFGVVTGDLYKAK